MLQHDWRCCWSSVPVVVTKCFVTLLFGILVMYLAWIPGLSGLERFGKLNFDNELLLFIALPASTGANDAGFVDEYLFRGCDFTPLLNFGWDNGMWDLPSGPHYKIIIPSITSINTLFRYILFSRSISHEIRPFSIQINELAAYSEILSPSSSIFLLIHMENSRLIARHCQ